MQILPRIQEIIDAQPEEAQLDKFIADIRDGLVTSNKQFINLSVLVITALATYHLVAYEVASGVTLNSIKISDATLFHRVFLIVPAALLGALSCVGYLRRWQREVYDFLAISRCRVIGKTGLHELRLPPDYILGLFILGHEGGRIGKAISRTVAFLLVFVFTFAPAFYIIREAAENIATFGIGDYVAVTASVIATVLSLCSLVIVHLAGHIKP